MDIDNSWMSSARCRTELFPDAWFPDSRTETAAIEAKRICRGCPVRRECKAAGNPERFGIWGGVFRSETTSKAGVKKLKEVPASGARHRLQALATLGWSGKDVSGDIRRYTGLLVSPKRLDALRAGAEDAVPSEVAEVVARAFKHLSTTLNSGNSAANTIGHATANGWLTPRQWRGRDLDGE